MDTGTTVCVLPQEENEDKEKWFNSISHSIM